MSMGSEQNFEGGGLRRLYYWFVGYEGRAASAVEIRGVALLFLILFGFSGGDIAAEAGYGPGAHKHLAVLLGVALMVVALAMFLVFADAQWMKLGGGPRQLNLTVSPTRDRLYVVGLTVQGLLTASIVMLTGGLFKSPYAVFLLGAVILAQITAGTSRAAVGVLLPFGLLCLLAAVPLFVSSLAIRADWSTPHDVVPIVIVVSATTWVNASAVADRAARRRESGSSETADA